MFFDKKTDLTNFTEFRAFYCRCMIRLMRDNLHIKLILTLVCILLCLGFVYFNYIASEAEYRPVDILSDP